MSATLSCLPLLSPSAEPGEGFIDKLKDSYGFIAVVCLVFQREVPKFTLCFQLEDGRTQTRNPLLSLSGARHQSRQFKHWG